MSLHSNKKEKKPTIRLVILSILVTVMTLLGSIRMMQYQIVEGSKYYDSSMLKANATISVSAARGEIVDSNGKLIVQNEFTNDILFYSILMNNDNKNDTILKMIRILTEAGTEWSRTLPIEYSDSGTFAFKDSGKSETDAQNIKQAKEIANVEENATAKDVIEALYEMFDLDTMQQEQQITDEEKFLIAEVRYGMEQVEFFFSGVYTFAEDISDELAAAIKEQNQALPGVNISKEPNRVYVDGTMAPHLIGQTGPILKEDWDTYQEKGYAMNEIVGTSGIEYRMEEKLRGSQGSITISQDTAESQQIVIEETSAMPGNTVQLTIDSQLQNNVQDLLASYIQSDASARAGAIAVLDIKSGEVLSLATYPSYDLNLYKSNFEEYNDDTLTPLLNRAIDGGYRPGSTFKTAVAVAGLSEGVISPSEYIYCTGTYSRFASSGFMPTCTGRHGSMEVTNALLNSCNIYFYETGYRLGLERIQDYCHALGLGVDTGLELLQSEGFIATQETLDAARPGDASQTAIGQMDVTVSPLQMATLAATIANRGTRYETHLVKAVYSHDKETVDYINEPVVANQMDNDIAFDYTIQGMAKVGNTLNQNGLSGSMAAKTGTPEKVENGATVFSSSVIGFYPVEDPQYAVAIYVENSKTAVKTILPNVFRLAAEREINEEASFYK